MPGPPRGPSCRSISGSCTTACLGATLVGLAFVLPSFFMVVALGAAYVAFGGIGWMQAVFYGVGARRDRHHPP